MTVPRQQCRSLRQLLEVTRGLGMRPSATPRHCKPRSSQNEGVPFALGSRRRSGLKPSNTAADKLAPLTHHMPDAEFSPGPQKSAVRLECDRWGVRDIPSPLNEEDAAAMARVDCSVTLKQRM